MDSKILNNNFVDILFRNNVNISDDLPINEEYSARHQLEILNIDINDIKEPVLDIGCGKSATLVNYLHELGLDVLGIDLLVHDSVYSKKTNWFNFLFKSKFWGTIISHMAFSNYFIYNHLRSDNNYIYYAHLYTVLLKSLKLDGNLIYSPGLPFIEKHLCCNQYRINNNKIDNNNNLFNNIAKTLYNRLGYNIFYSVNIKSIKN